MSAKAPSRRRRSRALARAVAVAAGLAAAAAVPASPTGNEAADRILVGAYVALVAIAAARAQRWTWIVAAGVAATFAEPRWATVLGAVAIVAAGAGSWPRRPVRWVGAAIGGAAATVTLRLVDGGHLGVSLAIGAVAAGPLLWSAYGRAHRRTRRVVRIAALGVGLYVVVAGLLYAAVAANTKATVDQGVSRLRAGLAAGRAGDVDQATADFDAAFDALTQADATLHGPLTLPARLVPVVGPNTTAIAGAVELAADLTDSTRRIVDDAGTDQLGMRGGRFDPAAFEALADPLGRLTVTLSDAEQRLAGLGSPWLVGPVGERLRSVATELSSASADVDLALQGVDALPALLGAGGERRYLVLFVTPVEARATGFVGNYAELLVQDGRFTMPVFGRIADLSLPPDLQLDLPAEFLARYQSFDVARDWRSVTDSPDFPSVAALARQLYLASGGPDVDGVLTVDPAALASLLSFTGPISLDGLDDPLTADNAEDFLLRRQYLEFPDVPDRVDALETLGRATFDRLTAGDLPSPQQMARTLGPIEAAGHLRLSVFDPAVEPFLHRVGIDHALPPPAPDGIAVTSRNVSGGKVDLFLQRTVDYDATWHPDSGAISATLSVTVRNDAPSSGLPRYVIGDALSGEDLPLGTSRQRLSVYTPWALDAATLDGQPVDFESSTEGGYFVYGVTVELPPEGGEATFAVTLSGQTLSQDAYQLALWNQILANPDDVHVRITVAGTNEFGTTGLDRAGRLTSANVSLTAPQTLEIHAEHTDGP